MNFKILITFFLWVGLSAISYSQQNTEQSTTSSQDSVPPPRLLTVEEYIQLQLPPLEVLFENARNNPRLKILEAAINSAEYDRKLTKRDWFKYLSLHAGYNYGILGTYVDHETQYQPLTTTYSGSTQHSWSIGAGISIPLDHLLNHRLTVKKQNTNVQAAQYNHESAFNEIKGAIIEIYSNIKYKLAILRTLTKSSALHGAEYKVAEANFMNNVSEGGLSNLKGGEQEAKISYELTLTELTILFAQLELISNTKITSIK